MCHARLGNHIIFLMICFDIVIAIPKEMPSRHCLKHQQALLLRHKSAFACPSEQTLNDLAICFGLRERTDVHRLASAFLWYLHMA